MTKLTLSKDSFLQAINRTVTLAQKNAVESVQSGIKLTFEDGFLFLEASSIDAHLKYQVKPESVEEVTSHKLVVVAPDVLKNQTRTLQKQIELEFCEKSFFLRSGGTFEIISHADAEYFPLMEKVEGVSRVVCGDLFKKALERIYPCLSINPSQNYALTGARLSFIKDFLEFVGTDMRCLVRVKVPTSGEDTSDTISILPRPVVSLLRTIKEDQITLVCSDKYLRVEAGPIQINAILISSEYPNLDAVFRDLAVQVKTELTVSNFLTALQQIEPIAENAEGVRFVINTPEMMEMQTVAEGKGRAQVDLKCKSDTPGIQTVLLPGPLIQFLKYVPEAGEKLVDWNICKPLSNGSTPSQLVVHDDVLDFMYLVMPMEI